MIVARQRGWTRSETIRAAVTAGAGHTITSLVLGIVIWFAGAELGARFGHLVEILVAGTEHAVETCSDADRAFRLTSPLFHHGR